MKQSNNKVELTAKRERVCPGADTTQQNTHMDRQSNNKTVLKEGDGEDA